MDAGSVIIAGDTFDQRVPNATFQPGDGWTLKYRLQPLKADGTVDPLGTAIQFTANVVDAEFRIQVGPDVTKDWAPASYKWSAWVEKPGARYTVDEGFATIKPDPAVSNAGTDPRSHARRVLAQIETAIEGWSLTGGHIAEYEIAGRRMRYADRSDVLEMRKQYRAEVWREDAAAAMAQGAPNPRMVNVRFGRA